MKSPTNHMRIPALPPSVESKNIIDLVFSETKKDKYSILTFPTHERYESGLAKTGHDFYAFRAEGLKNWNEDYAKRPDNYYILPENAIYNGIQFDFILAQSKFGQFQTAKLLQERLGIPIISLEHTLPTSVLKQEWLDEIKTMAGDVNVFISEYSRDEWGLVDAPQVKVVHHGVDSETFKPNGSDKEDYVLSVVNDFANRDYCCNFSGWQRVTDGLETRLVGDNGDLGKPADSLEELVSEYNKAKVFLNTSTVSPVPTSLLEAMACGCAVVTTATCMIPEIVKNEENGLISNNEDELRAGIERLLKDDELRENLGKNARKTVIEKFSEKNFVENWKELFDYTYGVRR